MKVVLEFFNQDHKSDIIAPFIKMNNCKITKECLIISNVVKIDFKEEYIKCFCMGLNVAELILSSICHIDIGDDNNYGNIEFAKELTDVILQAKINNFDEILQLASTGNVQYINTEEQQLKMSVKLSQWLSASMTVKDNNAYINFKLIDYEVSTNDHSANRFCTRVKQHPLVSAAMLTKYFEFGDEIKLKPNIEYLCFWKMLKSENGYKKYSNFMNECKDIINVEYKDGKKYTCSFDGGKIEFQLIDIGDKYPKKVILQLERANKLIIESLQKNLNLKTIELVSKITNLKLNSNQLLKDLRFFKADKFFMFENVYKLLKAEYDISTNTMIVKQEMHLDKMEDIDDIVFVQSMKDTKEWINNILKLTE